MGVAFGLLRRSRWTASPRTLPSVCRWRGLTRGSRVSSPCLSQFSCPTSPRASLVPWRCEPRSFNHLRSRYLDGHRRRPHGRGDCGVERRRGDESGRVGVRPGLRWRSRAGVPRRHVDARGIRAWTTIQCDGDSLRLLARLRAVRSLAALNPTGELMHRTPRQNNSVDPRAAPPNGMDLGRAAAGAESNWCEPTRPLAVR